MGSFLPVKDQFKGQLLMYLSEGIAASFHHRTSNMYPFLLAHLLCHKTLDMFCSMSALIFQILFCEEDHIFLMLPEKILAPSLTLTVTLL